MAIARLLSVSIPDDLMRETDDLARATGKTRSDLVRDALKRQVELERFRSLQRYGRRQAEGRGVGPEDVETLIDDQRKNRG